MFCNEELKAKFVSQPCVLPVACPAALCDLCLQFVFLWPFHQLNSYDSQRPEKPQGQCITKLQLKAFRTKHIDASKLRFRAVDNINLISLFARNPSCSNGDLLCAVSYQRGDKLKHNIQCFQCFHNYSLFLKFEVCRLKRATIEKKK